MIDRIQNGEWHVVLGDPKLATDAIQSEQVHQQLGRTTEVHFYPKVKGNASGKWVTAIVGVVLVVVGVIYGLYTEDWATAGQIIKMGVGLIISGTISALSQKPNVASQGGASNPSYFFNGGENTNQQGGPVPLVFGRCGRAGSVMISQAITVGAVA